MPDIYAASTKLLSNSGVVGTSGVPTRLFHMAIYNGTGDATVNFRNGSSISSQIYIQKFIDSAKHEDDFGKNGHLFKNGLFVEYGGGTILVSFSQ